MILFAARLISAMEKGGIAIFLSKQKHTGIFPQGFSDTTYVCSIPVSFSQRLSPQLLLVRGKYEEFRPNDQKNLGITSYGISPHRRTCGVTSGTTPYRIILHRITSCGITSCGTTSELVSVHAVLQSTVSPEWSAKHKSRAVGIIQIKPLANAMLCNAPTTTSRTPLAVSFFVPALNNRSCGG